MPRVPPPRRPNLRVRNRTMTFMLAGVQFIVRLAARAAVTANSSEITAAYVLWSNAAADIARTHVALASATADRPTDLSDIHRSSSS